MYKKIMSCVNSIFCPSWAEFKYVERKETIRDETICDSYETFKKRDKDNIMPECHCETCESRVKDDEVSMEDL